MRAGNIRPRVRYNEARSFLIGADARPHHVYGDRYAMQRTIILALLFALGGASIAFAQEATHAPQAHTPLSVRTLTRFEDPVILRGEDLPGMLGHSAEGLRAYALREGRLSPIPYQVDEFDKKGRVICTEGKDARQDKDKGLLDANDEVVVMASDLGDRAPRLLFPSDAREASEIEVQDPGTGERAWFYIFDFEAPPPPSPKAYVRYDPEKDLAASSVYLVDFNERRSILLDDMRIAGPDKKMGKNIIDRIKVRTWFKSRLFITFKFNEEDITSRVTSYKNGPVRSIRSAEYFLKLFFIKVTPSAFVDYLFYRNAIVGPSELKVPFSPRLVLRGGSRAITGLDFSSAIYGWQFYTEKDPTLITLDGRNRNQGEMRTEGVSWFALFGEDRGTVTRVVYGPSLLKAEQKYVFYHVDDKEKESKPERERGETLLAFDLDLLKIPRGTHKMWFYQFFASPFVPGDEARFNIILDRPLENRALAVSIPRTEEIAPAPKAETRDGRDRPRVDAREGAEEG